LQFGAADDYALGAANIPYSYTWELPGGGTGGFNPPASEIIPVVTETWDGIVAMVTRAAANAILKQN
jgi:hypothetical protein